MTSETDMDLDTKVEALAGFVDNLVDETIEIKRYLAEVGTVVIGLKARVADLESLLRSSGVKDNR